MAKIYFDLDPRYQIGPVCGHVASLIVELAAILQAISAERLHAKKYEFVWGFEIKPTGSGFSVATGTVTLLSEGEEPKISGPVRVERYIAYKTTVQYGDEEVLPHNKLPTLLLRDFGFEG